MHSVLINNSNQSKTPHKSSITGRTIINRGSLTSQTSKTQTPWTQLLEEHGGELPTLKISSQEEIDMIKGWGEAKKGAYPEDPSSRMDRGKSSPVFHVEN
jgi:hypothetical protein